MLCWLEEEEMSVQEFLARVGCVITHVGEFSPPLDLRYEWRGGCGVTG